ncbi:MAG TPA: hypothetical protein VK543_18985 [Puia sp.]|nr:hypothetical protein [Puia sp.]
MMKTIYKLSIVFVMTAGCISTDSFGQPYPDKYYDDTLMQHRIWLDLSLMLNPIYSFNLSSKYILNGHKLKNLNPTPTFYAVQPGKNPFSGLGEIADQANAFYISFRLPKWADSGVFSKMNLFVGITHDKLQTISSNVIYHFRDGGTELTLGLDKNITAPFSKHIDFKEVNLLFNIDIQAGLFLSLANAYTNITLEDTVIKSATDDSYLWQLKDPYLGGWGWLFSGKFEIGGVLCHKYLFSTRFTKSSVGGWFYGWLRHVAVTVGFKTMVEGLYTSPQVKVNGIPGSRLKVNNYGFFFVGPIFTFKYLNF